MSFYKIKNKIKKLKLFSLKLLFLNEKNNKLNHITIESININ